MCPTICHLKLASLAFSVHPFPTAPLFSAFSNPEGILGASERELRKVQGLLPATIRSILGTDHRDVGERELAVLEASGVRVVSYDEPEYPENLRQIQDPPPVLFVKGRLLPEDRKAVAVVGSRRASPYGVSVCQEFARSLAEAGFCVVSGMALGIDAVAHWTALESRGRTIGILGTGIDRVYPKAHCALFARVPDQGALVTEFPFGTPPLAWNFPRRNRLISGMSLGILVIEASERSGTAITVRMALEQGREVFAVPGDIRSATSRGTHRLIREGARMAESIEDILDELRFPRPQPLFRAGRTAAVGCLQEELNLGNEDPDSPGEDEDPDPRQAPAGLAVAGQAGSSLLRLMDDQGTSIEKLVLRTGWPPAKVACVLTELELLEKVRKLPGNRYVRLQR